MNSCLYKAKVMHNRLAPKKHTFGYTVFMFYLDLDEIDELAGHLRWMSRNRFNLFNFRDKDHLQLAAPTPDVMPGGKTAEMPDAMPDGETVRKPDGPKDIRQHLTDYLQIHGVTIGNGSIRVLTNLCTLGYQFNPVSFYFCYDEQGKPLCSVVEVGNTFHEMKPYFLGEDCLGKDGGVRNEFHARMPKYFYVSPFTDMDTFFDFDLSIPDEKLRVKIDDYDREGNLFFISTLSGKRKELTDGNLLYYFFSIPFVTLKVIWLIHWQALRLWWKKLPYHPKSAHPDLQRGVYRPYRPGGALAMRGMEKTQEGG